MKKKHLLTVAVAVLAMIFCSCGNPQPISDVNTEQLNKFGNILVSDLQKKILPNRQNPDSLTDYGYVIVKSNISRGTDNLAEFYINYEDGKDGDVTIIFTNSSFVVTRVVYSDNMGYYLRYEYDKSKPDEISVSGKLVNGISLKYQNDPPKWEMILQYDKKQIAALTLNNPSDG